MFDSLVSRLKETWSRSNTIPEDHSSELCQCVGRDNERYQSWINSFREEQKTRTGIDSNSEEGLLAESNFFSRRVDVGKAMWKVFSGAPLSRTEVLRTLRGTIHDPECEHSSRSYYKRRLRLLK